MNTRPERLVAALAFVMIAGGARASLEPDAQPIRPFGYTMGDVVHQTLHLTPGPGQTLDEKSLPKEGRAGAWLQRRAVVASREGGGWRIDMTYQFINTPPEIRTVALPTVKIQLREGDRIVEETLTESPVTLAPLTPKLVLARAGLEEMRPDAPPPLIDTTPQRQRLTAYAALAGLIALAWAAWYFGISLRGRRKRPFARAERDVRKLLAGDGSSEQRRDAMRALHRAFDATAGTTVFGESLDAFFTRHASLAPARDAAAGFFAASRAEFFGHAGAAGDFDRTALLALVGQLKSLERDLV